MATWQEVKLEVAGKSFDLENDGPGRMRIIVPAGAPACAYTFEYIATGTNKYAFKVSGEPWVLLFSAPSSNTGTNNNRRRTVAEEVGALMKVARNGAPVPLPFDDKKHASTDFLFDFTAFYDGDEALVAAYLMEYLPRGRYVEMDKRDDRASFMSDKVLALPSAPTNKMQTYRDVARIRVAMLQGAWGDFQVMYDKNTGRVLVFDPLDSDPNKIAYLEIMNKWLDDLS